MDKSSTLIAQAQDMLSRTKIDYEDALRLARDLKKEELFSYSRKLYGRARQQPEARWPEEQWCNLSQEHSLVTYKDPDLPADQKFDMALAILRQGAHLPTTTDQETLGQAGAIFKRKWEMDGQRGNLERALGYYYRGYQQGIAKDQGYTAINAAYVLDLLALQEERAVSEDRLPSVSVEQRRELARKIRQEIVTTLKDLPIGDDDYWTPATLAEACFGLGDFPGADKWLGETKKRVADSWKRQTTIQQIFMLARFRRQSVEQAEQIANEAKQTKENLELRREEVDKEVKRLTGVLKNQTDNQENPAEAQTQLAQTTEQLDQAKKDLQETTEECRRQEKNLEDLKQKAEQARTVLLDFVGNEAALEHSYLGKVGLALSGGGFRASLFHIGVLAKLADLGVLHRVEVLSCVSGGSIVGAHYYLELRKLLKEKADADLTREDYIRIVENLEREFPAGVRKNLRTRVIANPFRNLWMILSRTYSRTNRLGELYEKHLYARVDDEEGDDPRYLNNLFIEPAKAPKGFNPKRDNWQRKHKVPMLVLNATTLNTGHNWQFTASFMGEPPSAINTAVDSNYRLRRMYYKDQAPTPHDRIRLGYAVAASSCVPGMFQPLTLDGLYEKKVVRLVDGGVYDNQGVACLLEQDCKVMLVSDASGQMGTIDEPSGGELGVVMRASSISQERVRHAQYRELAARLRAGALRGLMFVHLKKDLNVEPIDWRGCLDSKEDAIDALSLEQRHPVTSYGIHKELQRHLAGIRTDLDSFTESEAQALMASGYLMTEDEFQRGFRPFDDLNDERVGFRSPWHFLKFEEPLKQFGRQPDLGLLLKTAGQSAFKAWQLLKPLRVFVGAVGVLLAAIPVTWILKPDWWLNAAWLKKSIFTLSFATPWFQWRAGEGFPLEPILRTLTFSPSWGALYLAVLALVLGRYFGPTVMRLVGWRKTLSEAAFAGAASVVGFLVSWLHLVTIDWLYLKWGKSKRVIARDRSTEEK